MARPVPQLFEFSEASRDDVLVAMGDLAPRDGRLVLQPGFEGEAPRTGGSFGFFSARGPVVPVCTWVPGERSRNGIEHVALGIEHGTGPGAKTRLVDRGHPIPEGWEVMADHSKRGIVVAVHPEVPHDEVLDWLLVAGRTLSLIPLTGDWRAFAYRR